MHNESLPPSDRTEPPQWNEALRARLRELRNGKNADRRPYYHSALAAKLGVSPSIVSQYLPSEDSIREYTGGQEGAPLPPVKYPGDIRRLERAIEDLLAADALRQRGGITNAETDLTRTFRTAVEFVRRTNDCGAVVAESGSGKTRAVAYYLTDNPTAIHIQVTTWNHDINAVVSMLFAAAPRGGYDHRTRRADWIAKQFAGTDRLILVDDAHKLTRPALQYLFDLHDATQCPLVLIGTPELLRKIDDDSQRASRLGYREQLGASETETLVKHLVRQLAPEAGRELVDVCARVAAGDGAYRRAEKLIRLAARYHEACPEWTWGKCATTAERKLNLTVK